MYQTPVIERDHGLADRRSGLHHAVGDAAGEVVLEERPRLAHHVPVALPAHQVADIGGDRLVCHDVLSGDRGWPREQQHQRHAEQKRSVVGEQVLGLRAGDEGHDPADEDRDHGVEQRHQEAGDEQRCEQALGLAGKVPIERHQAGRRHGLLR